MKRKKIVSLLEGSIKNKMLVSVLALSLVGASGMTVMSSSANRVNSLPMNQTMLAQLDSSSIGHITNVSTAVNLRSNPTTNSSVLTSLKNNTSVTVLQKQGNWYKINANGIVGYIYQNYITTSNQNNTPSSSTKIVIHNVDQAKALVAQKIGTSDKDGKIVWTYMSNSSGNLFTGNNGVKYYFIRGEHQSFINHREKAQGAGSYDGLDYYVLQNGTIINANSTDNTNTQPNSSSTVAHITNVSTAVNLRSNPTTSSKVLTSLKNNTPVTVLQKQGNWYKINANGTVGYIYQNYITTSNQNNTSSSSAKNDNTVVIKNTTGQAISNDKLAGYMRQWISNNQATEGTNMWAPEFLNAVPNSQLVKAFIDANGESALNGNITSSELSNANTKLVAQVNKNPVLSQTQIYDYIYKNILPKNHISKIVNKSNVYYIYSMMNGKEVFYCYLNPGTGFHNS